MPQFATSAMTLKPYPMENGACCQQASKSVPSDLRQNQNMHNYERLSIRMEASSYLFS